MSADCTISGVRCHTVDGFFCVSCSTGGVNRPAFEYYLREMLLPCLRPGQVLVIDNLSVHHGDSIETMVSEVGYSCSTCLPTLRT